MTRIFGIACLALFASCASPVVSIKEQKLRCIERFLAQNVDALKAKEVCSWGFERQ